MSESTSSSLTREATELILSNTAVYTMGLPTSVRDGRTPDEKKKALVTSFDSAYEQAQRLFNEWFEELAPSKLVYFHGPWYHDWDVLALLTDRPKLYLEKSEYPRLILPVRDPLVFEGNRSTQEILHPKLPLGGRSYAEEYNDRAEITADAIKAGLRRDYMIMKSPSYHDPRGLISAPDRLLCFDHHISRSDFLVDINHWKYGYQIGGDKAAAEIAMSRVDYQMVAVYAVSNWNHPTFPALPKSIQRQLRQEFDKERRNVKRFFSDLQKLTTTQRERDSSYFAALATDIEYVERDVASFKKRFPGVQIPELAEAKTLLKRVKIRTA